jgi:hypothetical protein
MYSIDSTPISNDSIEMKIFYERLLIGSKILELNFNENKKATFVESGYEYFSEDFNNFINNVESLTEDKFSFDDQDRFDGFELVKLELKMKTEYFLIFKVLNDISNMSIYISIDKDSAKGIVSDLKVLYNLLNKTIDGQLEYYDKLENVDKYVEEI